MPFAYYNRLSAADKRVYRKSAAIGAVPLPDAAALLPRVAALDAALATGKQRATQRAASALVDGITDMLGVERVVVRVLRQRPRNDWGELHGYYTRPTDAPSTIEVWMRTAANARIVAFRTFVRTLLHEVCHHLDFVHFHLTETFHTEGFLRRESSLVRQLAGRSEPRRERPADGDGTTPRAKPRQLSLAFDPPARR